MTERDGIEKIMTDMYVFAAFAGRAAETKTTTMTATWT